MRKILIIQCIVISLFGLVSCQNKNAELEKKIQLLEKENAEILKKQNLETLKDNIFKKF